MTDKQTPAEPMSEFDRAEWDFSEARVPAAELEACFLYEHAREMVKMSVRLAKLVAKRKAHYQMFGSDRAAKTLSEIVNLFSKCFDTTLKIDLSFPETPWQSLMKSNRLTIISEIKDGRLNQPDKPFAMLLEAKLDAATQFKAFRSIHGTFRDYPKHAQYGFVVVDWSFSDEAIVDALRAALVSKRPLKRVREQKRRGTYRDKLRCLGTLRMFQHYGARQLNSLRDAPYADFSDLYKARKKAQVLLRGLISIIEGS